MHGTRDHCDDTGVRLLRLLVIAGPPVLLACATPARRSTSAEPPLSARVQGPGLLFEVFYTGADAREVPRIEQGLLLAGVRVARWGSFREGVFVHVLPDHAALEDAVARHGYPWLRAWAFGDQVLLQSPRTWICDPPAQDDDVTELLTHELTHALMYQLMQRGTDPSWAAEEPPLWFREGMASVTADQGRRPIIPAPICSVRTRSCTATRRRPCTGRRTAPSICSCASPATSRSASCCGA